MQAFKYIIFIALVSGCASVQTMNRVHIGMKSQEVVDLIGISQNHFKDKNGYRHIYRLRRSNPLSFAVGVGTLGLGLLAWEEELNTDCIVYTRDGSVYRDPECKDVHIYEPVRATKAEKCPNDNCS